MPDPASINQALRWFRNNLGTYGIDGEILFAGKWQASWRRDFPSRTIPNRKTKAMLSLYTDAAAEAQAKLDHLAIYLEVTTDEVLDARKRVTQAGFGDVTIEADNKQRYVIARKVGR